MLEETNLKRAKEITSLEMVYLLIIMAFLLISPYYKGLFNGMFYVFEKPIYMSVLFGSILLLLVSIKWYAKINSKSTMFLIAASIVIPIIQLLSMFSAVSMNGAMTNWLLSLLFIGVFIVGFRLSSGKKLKYLYFIVIISGYLITLVGIAIMFGTIQYQDGIVNNRLSSVFQYPNTYSSFLISVFICNLCIIFNSRTLVQKGLNAAMSFPIILSLYFTFSRGGLLVFGIILLLFLCFQKTSRQFVVLINLGVVGLAIVLVYPFYYDKLLIYSSLSGIETFISWLYFIGISILCAVIYLVLDFYLSKLTNQVDVKINRFIIPVMLLILGSVFITGLLNGLFGTVGGNRYNNINIAETSIAERNVFYEDSIRIANDYPVFGAGGGAWSNLYEKYQEYPYSSKQVHNFPLQLLVENGYFGLLLTFAFIASIIFFYLRSYKMNHDQPERIAFFFIVITILIHSIIDFDLSFAYINILLFLSLGVLVNDFNHSPMKKTKKLQMIGVGSTVIFVCMSVAGIYFSAQFLAANNHFAKAMSSSNFSYVDNELREATKLNKFNPTYSNYKIEVFMSVYKQTGEKVYLDLAKSELHRIEKHEKSNVNLAKHNYLILVEEDDLLADQFIKNILSSYRWNAGIYQTSINKSFELGELTADSENPYWNNALDYYKVLNRSFQSLENENDNLTFRKVYFRQNPIIPLRIGQIYYEQGKYAEGAAVLHPAVTTTQMDQEIYRIIARYYLANLNSQGLKDDNIYNYLTKHYPEEETNIQLLVQNRS